LLRCALGLTLPLLFGALLGGLLLLALALILACRLSLLLLSLLLPLTCATSFLVRLSLVFLFLGFRAIFLPAATTPLGTR